MDMEKSTVETAQAPEAASHTEEPQREGGSPATAAEEAAAAAAPAEAAAAAAPAAEADAAADHAQSADCEAYAEARHRLAAMISTLRDRIDDLEEAFEAYDGPIGDYVKRLDLIDDKVYAIEAEFEKFASLSEEEKAAARLAAKQGSRPKPKSEMAQLAQESAETIGEFAEAVRDIRSAFDFRSKPSR